jgi:hypothetical protein
VKSNSYWVALAAGALCLALLPACPAQGVGDPCTPEDEYSPTFSGFSLAEVSTESRSFSCQSRLCLVNHFQGRVSCPYGQTVGAQGEARCFVPSSDEPVSAPVQPQLLERRAQDSVYCSCRCAGPDPSARYCECPSGFSCSEVIPSLTLGRAQLPGSYCIKSGSELVPSVSLTRVCSRANASCDDE